MNDGEKPVEESRKSSKVEMFKTMIHAKKKQWNYARWAKYYGSNFDLKDAKKDWDMTKC